MIAVVPSFLSVPDIHSADLVWRALLVLALAGSFSSTIYLAMTLLATSRFLQRAQAAQAAVNATPRSSLPPVTIFKPLHGMEEQLAANLESFFQQDYPDYEVIFGVRDLENPAAKIAEKIRGRYPHVPSRIIVSGTPEWPNAKVFALQKMIAASTRSYFIISDSDVRVAPDFLRNTIPPLLDPAVGLVTCMYRGIPSSDFWSWLEALGLSGDARRCTSQRRRRSFHDERTTTMTTADKSTHRAAISLDLPEKVPDLGLYPVFGA